MRSTHPFGDLLSRMRARKPGLTQAQLAELTGYDPSVIARMGLGQKDLTGPQARERILRIVQVLDQTGVLNGIEEANALLEAATLPPLFAGNYVEAELMQQLALHRRAAPDSDLYRPSLPRHNLPAQLTSFIGREQEIAEVKQFLTRPALTVPQARTRPQARLVTLTGPGGVGKTRLALEVAGALLDDFGDGVWWVPLGSLTDPALVAQTLINTFGLNHQTKGSKQSVLVDYLAKRRLLLVLDNCEHLVDTCAELTAHLMGYCPSLCILATSREALQVPGEVTLRVPPLTAPHPASAEAAFLADQNRVMDFDAVRLFVERAQVMRPDFGLTTANTSAVVHICDRLDGIPLALELAAALLQVLSVEEIAARIDNRFTLLKGGYRTVTPRHQALSNAVDWSYELLTSAEQILLARLSVFVGRWDAEAAEAVCSDDGELKHHDVLSALRQLVNKSLVSFDEPPSGTTHYRLLKTIHEYATEKLQERKEHRMLKDDHLKYFVNVAETANRQLATREHDAVTNRLIEQQDELQAALNYAEQSGNAEALLRLAAALQSFWTGRGMRDVGQHWMDTALALGKSAPSHLRSAVMFAWAWTFPRDTPKLTELTPIAEACLAESRAAQDDIGIAQALTVLGGNADAVKADFPKARAQLEEALRIFEAHHDQRGIYVLRHKIGYFLREAKNPAAEAWMQDSINLYSAAGDKLSLSTTLADLAWTIAEKNPSDVRVVDLWRRSVDAARSYGDMGLACEFLYNLAEAELVAGDRAHAADHAAEALALACTINIKPSLYLVLMLACNLDASRVQSIMQGYLLGKQQAGDRHGIAAGIYFLGYAYLNCDPHDFERARQLFEQSQVMWRELGIVFAGKGSTGSEVTGFGDMASSLINLGQAQ